MACLREKKIKKLIFVVRDVWINISVMKSKICVLSGFIFSFFLLLFSVFLILLFFYQNNSVFPEVRKSQTFQITTFHPTDVSLTQTGLVKLPHSLSTTDYHSFHNDKTGTFSVISHVFNTEYVCEGECFCDSPTDRRVASVLNRGLYIVLTAFSLTMATKIAQDTFEDQCKEKLRGVCEASDSKRRHEECKQYSDLAKHPRVDMAGQYQEFMCDGHCLNNNQIVTKEGKIGAKKWRKDNIDDGDCKHLEMKHLVSINTAGEVIPATDDEMLTIRAKQLFHDQFLREFCKVGSRFHYVIVDEYADPTPYSVHVPNSACVSLPGGVIPAESQWDELHPLRDYDNIVCKFHRRENFRFGKLQKHDLR